MTALSNRPETTTVLGFPIQILDSYADWLGDRLTAGDSIHVVTLNAEMAIAAEQDPILADVIHKADLVIPDGAGVVLYLKLRGKRVERCPGIELSEEMLHRAGSQGWPVYFYGGKPGVAEAAAAAWRRRAPGIPFTGVSDGYIDAEGEAALLAKLQAEQPQLILVGLGVPRQEQWIQRHRQVCPNAIWIGCGGSFDIWSGTKARAPKFFCDNNLEWVYRLYQEPWRWRRMLALPVFAWKAVIGR
ncbi:MAG: WecB/TagA/CpsF family glycosyltransferase [Synechococcales cyanobacterium RM1_1_8]|nr:WecB/TagA/CpsF family glycosyltransferase [Synechococcales cyanobacterium RM1_1_8]